METIQDHQLSNQEKTLIAMGAAMGAGCRTCADKLHSVAASLNIPKADMLQAFLLGLEAKAEAVKTMQDKIAVLMNGTAGGAKDFPAKLAAMIRMASFTAANSAPDCLVEIKQAVPSGITAGEAQLCIATGKMVRKNAMGFSDQELSEQFFCSKSDTQGACCPGTANVQNASGCSCG